MLNVQPKNLEQLSAIEGVGRVKVVKYGNRILEVIRQFGANNVSSSSVQSKGNSNTFANYAFNSSNSANDFQVVSRGNTATNEPVGIHFGKRERVVATSSNSNGKGILPLFPKKDNPKRMKM